MGAFIARMVIRQADNSIEKGQEKYKAYFINTTLYLKWKKDADTILETEGYNYCIVSE